MATEQRTQDHNGQQTDTKDQEQPQADEESRGDGERQDPDDEPRREGEPGQEAQEPTEGEEEEPRSRITAVQAARRAKDQLSELTGLAADTVSGVGREDGNWQVHVELVELGRMPPSTDVLATYQVTLDGAGELTGYERVQRYLRSQAQ